MTRSHSAAPGTRVAVPRSALRMLLAAAAIAVVACQSPPPASPPPVAAAASGPAPASGTRAAAETPQETSPATPPQTPARAPARPDVAASAPPPPGVAAPAPPPPRPPRIGLALGGGAARGFAHIGAIQVLEEAGIRPDLIVGTSAGSLVAALYASGKTGQELAALALTMDEGAITDWTFPLRGVIRGEALARYVREHTGGRTIEQMKVPLGIVATDLDSGAPVLFRRGDTGTAVRASSSVPAVFQPVKIGEREYVDGGLVSPVPVHYARQMGAEVVIAIDITSSPEGNPTGDVFSLLMQTVSIMMRSINRLELRDADVVLRPTLTGVDSSDFSSRVRAVRAGREAAQRLLPQLKAKVAAPRG